MNNRRFIQVVLQFILFSYFKNFTVIQIPSLGSLYTLINKIVAKSLLHGLWPY